MPRLLVWACAFCLTAQMCLAQGFPIFEPRLKIGVIDLERLYRASESGESDREELLQLRQELVEETNALEAELTAEELALTARRETETLEAFTPLAEAFNEKANQLRERQRRRADELQAQVIRRRDVFFEKARPILVKMMEEEGIAILFDNSTVISRKSLDLTDRAIKRIDDELRP